MVCVESQVPFILFLAVSVLLEFCSPCVLYVFALHLSIFSPSEYLFLALFEVVVVRPEIEIVLKLLDFCCVVNILFAFGRHVRSYHFYFYPFEVFEIKVSLLLIVVRIYNLRLVSHIMMQTVLRKL